MIRDDRRPLNLCFLAALAVGLAGCVPYLPPPGSSTPPREEPRPLPPPPPEGPRLRVWPSSVDFGRVRVGSSTTIDVTVENDGDQAVRGPDARAEGRDFRLEGRGCPGPLRPGDSCTLRVRFEPSRPGDQSGSLELRFPAPASERVAIALRGEGAGGRPPELVLSRRELDFGAVEAGGERVLEVEVRNEGEGDLRLQGVRAAGEGFEVASDGCGARPLGPGDRCSVAVRFAPARGGAYDGRLSVGSNDPRQGRAEVALRGEARRREGPPEVRVEPGRLDFGRVEVGLAKSQDLRIGNEGRSPLRVREVSVEGEGFRLGHDGCSDQDVLPGRSCTVGVSFEPRGDGRHRGEVSVATNDRDRRRTTVALEGEGERRREQVEVRFEPDRLDFGRLPAGEARTLDVRVGNAGRSPLRIESVRAEGQGFDVASDNCSGRAVPPGRECSVGVRFRPAAPGPSVGSLVVSGGGRDRPQLAVSLRGEGARAAVPDLRVQPPQLDFGRVAGGEARALGVEVRNDGQGRLDVRSVAVSGAGFRLAEDGCSRRDVPPGRTCGLKVEFVPSKGGPAQGELRIESNDPRDGRTSVPLRGEGARAAVPDLRVQPLQLDFGRVAADASATLDVEVRNDGQGRLDVRSVAVSGAGFRLAEDGCSRRDVPPGRTCGLKVEFVPSKGGPSQGELRIESNDPDEARIAVALRGLSVDRGTARPCRRENLELPRPEKGRSRLAVRGGLEPNACAIYTVRAPADGGLTACAPQGYRLGGDGWAPAGGKGKKSPWKRDAGICVERRGVGAGEEVGLMVTREERSPAGGEVAITWTGRGAGDED